MSSVKLYRGILSGSTGGIGRAMAARLAAISESLLLLGRDPSALSALRTDLLSQHPNLSVSCLSGDLLDFNYVKEVAAYANQNEVNLLVNNAGMNHFGSIDQIDGLMQAQIIHTNLLAPMQLTHAVLPFFIKQTSAQIIQVGSILGYIGYPGNAAYCASKFGLRGYSQAVSRELSNTSVKVKYLAPRVTNTAINSVVVDRLNSSLGVAVDQPEHVAQALIHLIQSKRFDLKIGFPERLYVFLNRFFPRINDAFIRKQLPLIEQHWRTE
jgi:short-subunit dehydrogenase